MIKIINKKKVCHSGGISVRIDKMFRFLRKDKNATKPF
jgi:hypothetical protein